MTELVLDLLKSIEEPARARAFVTENLAPCSADSRDDALLLVSELVANVVEHGELPARMLMNVMDAQLHVLVEDSGADMPADRPFDRLAADGRGLVIVAALATAWGISTPAGRPGKGVWFDLPIVP